MESRSSVRKLMKDRNLRAEDVSSKGKCSYSSFTQWLAGKQVEEETFAKFAYGLGITVDELNRLLATGSHQAAG